MSYIATCNGNFRIKEGKLNDELFDKVEPFFDSVEKFGSDIEVFYNGNYHEDNFCQFMNEMAEAAESGTLYCAGEDDSYWKFVVKDGNWKEYSGSIVYDDEPLMKFSNFGREEFLGQLIDQFQDILDEENKKLIIQGKMYADLKEKLLSTLKHWNII